MALDPYDAACLESVAGNVNHALELLALAVQQTDFDAEWARQDPDLAWVRDDPRFGAIVGNTTDRRDTDMSNLEQAAVEEQATD